MIRAISYKTKQFFLVLIKLSIVVGAFYFIYNKLVSSDNLEFSVFIQFLHQNGRFSPKIVIFILFLTILNWIFEFLKWKTLVSYIHIISFYKSVEQSLGSLTASLFTPNRIGEYAAKIMYYPSTLRKKVAFMNLLSNGFQMTVTITFGIIGLSLFIYKYDPDINFYKLARFSGIILFVLFFVYVTNKKNVLKFRGFSIEKILDFIKGLPLSVYTVGLGLSILRYAMFSLQFYILLYSFSIDVSYYNAMIVITSVYLLASVIPSIFIFDVVIKGSVAVYLFGIVGVNELTTLSIIMLMWLLNFVLPSIFGAVFVLKFKLPKAS